MEKHPGLRLKKVREALGLTQSQFADTMEVKWHKIKDIEIGKQKLSPDLAQIIEKKYYIDFKWLLTGEGEMYSARQKQRTENFVYIPKYQFSSSLNGQNTYTIQQYENFLCIQSSWLEQGITANTDNLFAMNVEGDAMEPTFKNGNIVIANKSETKVKNGIYVIRIDDSVEIKRIHRLHNSQSKIISDNKLYEPYTVKISSDENVEIIGKVVLHLEKVY
jgi:phage repressor protein C with HTH and peptisase S24 domain